MITQQLAILRVGRAPTNPSEDYDSEGSGVNALQWQNPQDVCRRHRRSEDPGDDLNLKTEILEHHGSLCSDGLMEQIETIERIFKFKEVLDEHKVKLVAMRL